MTFVSDAQRKHFFANNGGGGSDGGGSVPSFPDVGAGFVRMTSDEISSANRERNDGRIARDPIPSFPNVDGPAAGSRNPIPTMTSEESAAWRKGTNASGKY